MARPLGLARIVVLALLTLLLAGTLPAAAQDGPDLEAALLTAADLPDGFTSQDGVIQGSNFNLDQAAFDANNGQAIVSQVWSRQSDSGPVVVFDFRLLFPTPEDARNYLRDAEPVISERDASGLKLVKGEEAIGDLHRLYSGSQTISGTKIAFNNHLFTVGPTAAKVFVTGAPGSGGAARSIARKAAARTTAALETAPIPTLAPAPSSIPQASGAPDPSPPTGPDLSAIFEANLIAHVAEGITDCTPVKERVFAGELAGISCPIGSKNEVLVMRQLDSADSLATAFEPFKGDTTGPTGTCDKKAALEPRMVDGVQVGQLACYDPEDGSRVFIWTDERFDMMAWIVGTQERAFKALSKLYQSAGPVLPPDVPAPTATPEASTGPVATIQPGLSDAQAALALHVPGKTRGTCGPATVNVASSATAAVLCTATTDDGTIGVTYQQFDDQDALDTAYADDLDFLGATLGSGPCSGDWPAETTWTVNEVVGGRVACAEVGGIARDMAWTDNALLILGIAETFDVPKEALRLWWLDESGPIS